jgi:hypothetical protein
MQDIAPPSRSEVLRHHRPGSSLTEHYLATHSVHFVAAAPDSRPPLRSAFRPSSRTACVCSMAELGQNGSWPSLRLNDGSGVERRHRAAMRLFN